MDIERLAQRRSAGLLLLALGAALFLPFLGSFGLWDPYEVRIADMARELSQPGGAAPGSAALMRPPLTLTLIASGFRVLGAHELGGRLPIALAALAALAACFYAGTGLVYRRAAFLGAIALSTLPGFLLGARQLVTAAPVTLAAALAIGGGARLLWPLDERDTRWRLGHALLCALGLGLGQLVAGTWVGVAVPLIALALAALVAGVPDPVGRLLRLLIILAALGLTVAAALLGPAGKYTPLLGAVRRAGPQHAVVLVTVLRKLGFAAFPWIALLPLGLVRAAAPRRSTAPVDAAAPDDAAAPASVAAPDDAAIRRERFGRVLLAAWLGTAYVGATLQAIWGVEIPFPAFAAVALVAADSLDATLRSEERLGYAGFLVFLCALLLAHDFAEGPEHYGGAHIAEGIHWPGPVTSARFILLGLGLVWGLAIGLGLGLRPRPAPATAPPPARSWRERLILLGFGVALVQAGYTTYVLVPELSQHLSSKGLFSKYQALGGSDGELGQYRAAGRGIDYYFKDKARDLASLDQLFAFLQKPGRVFVVTPVEELAPIDQYAQTRGQARAYVVIDDSNSRFLLLSNRLGPGERDLNPLGRLVVRELTRRPQYELHADFEGKVELLGYDLPPVIERGKDFLITLYYRVKAPLGASYKVFIHFDGAGHRINGDHVPLDGKFPASNWVPGYYIIDEHKMTAERSTATAGVYQLYTGFWLGAQRLAVVSGPSDGDNRVKLGTVTIR